MTLKELAMELCGKSNGHFNGYKRLSIRWLMTYIQAMTRTETGKAVVTIGMVHEGKFVYVRISRDGDSFSYELSDTFW